MEKNIAWGSSADINFIAKSINNCIKSLQNSMKQPIEWLQTYYSIIMEKEVSMKQTLLLIATQFTFVLGILPADINLALRAAFLGSFAFCLHLCKKSFQEEI